MALKGVIQRDPERPVSLYRDCVQVDGKDVGVAEKLYLLLNKPRGLVTTRSDEQGRATVYEGLARDLPWLAPVGRLDKASEGLLLLTNDSQWAARILAPETHLAKTYHVQIASLADDRMLAALRKGVRDREGEMLRVRKANILRHGERNSWLEMVLDEGKNRHIRRMLEQLGIEVLRLVRVAIGPLALGELAKGKYRALTLAEKRLLDAAMRRK